LKIFPLKTGIFPIQGIKSAFRLGIFPVQGIKSAVCLGIFPAKGIKPAGFIENPL
jgi:hypothetical protein